MKLTLKGFQSHEETVLKVDGGLVCVTGPNNVGKSAVIRAARWLFYDALRGSRFFKKGEGTASVEMAFEDVWARRIKEKKSGGRNAYELSTLKDPLDAIGTGAPKEVNEALNIRPIRVDKDLELELNVVQQKDHPFLMDETGTTKAKVLNSLTGHHVLDIAIRDTVNLLRSLKSEEKGLIEAQDRLGRDLEAFADLPAKEVAVAQARALNEGLMLSVEKARRMREALTGLDQAKAVWYSLYQLPVPDVAALEVLWNRFDTLSSTKRNMNLSFLGWEQAKNAYGILNLPQPDVEVLNTLWNRLEAIVPSAQAMRSAQALLANAQADYSLLFTKPIPDADALDRSLLKLEEAHVKKASLISTTAARMDLAREEQAQARMELELDRTLNEFKALAGSQCGACGQVLTADCLQEVA